MTLDGVRPREMALFSPLSTMGRKEGPSTTTTTTSGGGRGVGGCCGVKI